MKKEVTAEQQNTKELFIWAWEWGHGIDPGHVAIQIGDFVYGFTYEGKKYIPNAIGEMTKETESELAEAYVVKHFDQYKKAVEMNKKVLPEENPSSRTAHVYCLCASAGDHSFLNDRYEELHVNPPPYHRDDNNCVTTTIDSLQELNLINIEYVNRPGEFIQQMDKVVGSGDAFVRGFITSKRKLHVRHNGNRGYFWATEEANIKEMLETEAS